MHLDWIAQRSRPTVTSTQALVVRIAAVAGTVGLLAVSAPVTGTAVSVCPVASAGGPLRPIDLARALRRRAESLQL